MDRVITLFERQAIPYPVLDLTANDPLLETIDRLNQNAGKELIRLERKGLRTTQYVGVIQVGGRTIQILPKIDCDPEADTEAVMGSSSYERASVSAAQNFLHLLTHARRLKLHNQSLASLSTNRGTWLEMLTRLFAVELLTQLQQGFHQDYVRREDLLPYVRGRWNIATAVCSTAKLNPRVRCILRRLFARYFAQSSFPSRCRSITADYP